MRALFHACRRRAGACLLPVLVALAACTAPVPGGHVGPAPRVVAESPLILCYHEVRDDVRNYPDPYAVDSSALVAQFSWLRGNGYTPVTLEAVIAARNGGAPLPPKAVLLTFDDGYVSFYTRVYPLLRAFHYPAVLGVVGKWIDHPEESDSYGEQANVTHASFPTWAQIREMADSGLVEVASHTYDLHRGIPANPQGNVEPAATTRLYDTATRAYEDDAHWRARVRADLARNSDLIERETGHRPRAVVWPYGSYNDELIAIAGELGMPADLTLDDGANTPQVPLTLLRRHLVLHNPNMADFSGDIAGVLLPEPVRVVEVGLDAVYDPDPAQEEKNLSALLDRVLALAPTHVFLRVFGDSADEMPKTAYFPNGSVPMRSDLANRVAWQLATRSDVKVYAALPPALSRMQPAAAAALVGDLARAVSVNGLYFMPGAADPVHLAQASSRLAQAAAQWRAPLSLARGIAAAQASPAALAALKPGARMVVVTGAPSAVASTAALVPVLARAAGEARVVWLLDDAPPDGAALAARMRALRRAGVADFGYREGDFLHDRPEMALVAPALSTRDSTLR